VLYTPPSPAGDKPKLAGRTLAPVVSETPTHHIWNTTSWFCSSLGSHASTRSFASLGAYLDAHDECTPCVSVIPSIATQPSPSQRFPGCHICSPSQQTCSEHPQPPVLQVYLGFHPATPNWNCHHRPGNYPQLQNQIGTARRACRTAGWLSKPTQPLNAPVYEEPRKPQMPSRYMLPGLYRLAQKTYAPTFAPCTPKGAGRTSDDDTHWPGKPASFRLQTVPTRQSPSCQSLRNDSRIARLKRPPQR